MKHIETISDEAAAVGSVNTIYLEEDKVPGCNTDVSGFIESLKDRAVSLKDLRVTIIAAGGAARSAISLGR